MHYTFLTPQEEAKIKEKAGIYWKSLAVTTVSEGKEKSQSGMQLYENAMSMRVPVYALAQMTDRESVSLRTELPRSVPRRNGFETSQSSVLSRVPSCSMYSSS